MKKHTLKIFGRGLWLLCLALAGFTTDGKPRKMQNLASGLWGGLHITINIENGSATVNYDCAHGTISGPFKIDSKGNFSFTGNHMRERPGPTRMDGDSQGQPAHYTGWTDGKKMTLVVTLAESKEEVGKFELEHGRSGRIFKCK
jgi:hypothetical protein